RRRHTRFSRDWSSDVCSSDLTSVPVAAIQSLLRSRALADGSSEVFVAANAGSDIARFRLDASNTVQALPPVAVGSGFSAWLPGRSEERRVGKEGRAVVGTSVC